jgi:hypothetical protein
MGKASRIGSAKQAEREIISCVAFARKNRKRAVDGKRQHDSYKIVFFFLSVNRSKRTESTTYYFILVQVAQQNQSELRDFIVADRRHFVRIPLRIANELGREILIKATDRVSQVDEQQKFR